eukprot:TRINITY_DN33893_c0_g1_i1.p1 TRINITY_DN33893_c0_g1~~TRINITY_DN33893_c0_g1_i1.p1  ORF type:complete len:377 (-),score=62.32 TRINITY_DN33893_c0_g1_i1:60-1190(-)
MGEEETNTSPSKDIHTAKRIFTALTAFLGEEGSPSHPSHPPLSTTSSSPVSSTPLRPLKARHVVQSPAPSNTPSSLGLCQPTDRNHFYERLQTFRPFSWFGNPFLIGPQECARLGWVNCSVEMLACGVCGARLCFRTPQWSDEAAAAVAVKDFHEKLKTGHRDLCPWRDNPSPTSFRGVPERLPAEKLAGFRDRRDRLVAAPLLPCLAADALESLQKVAEGDSSSQSLLGEGDPKNEVACALAIFGWDVGESSDALRCCLCGRTAGLWNFVPWNETQEDVPREETEEKKEEEESIAKRVCVSVDTRQRVPFHPINQHRYFCPWITTSPECSHGDDTKPQLCGWKSLVQSVSEGGRDRSSWHGTTRALSQLHDLFRE